MLVLFRYYDQSRSQVIVIGLVVVIVVVVVVVVVGVVVVVVVVISILRIDAYHHRVGDHYVSSRGQSCTPKCADTTISILRGGIYLLFMYCIICC